MPILCVAMSMFIMKISQRQRRCLSMPLILILDTIVLGGDKEILHISNKNMIGHTNLSREQFKLILRILFFILLWG